MSDVIVTNNSKVESYCHGKYDVLFVDGDYERVLLTARDMIHKGAVLLTHPLSGSVKPGETPFKSVLLSGTSGSVDCDSLLLIEEAIAAYVKFSEMPRVSHTYDYTENILEDFREIDFTLIFNALR